MVKAEYVLAGVGIGILALTFLPLWKTGQQRGLNMWQVLARHTIFTEEPETVMVEDSYRDDFLGAGMNGERRPY